MCSLYLPSFKNVEFDEQLIKELKQKGNKRMVEFLHFIYSLQHQSFNPIHRPVVITTVFFISFVSGINNYFGSLNFY